MSTTIGSVLVQMGAVILPLLGIQVGTEALTTTVQTVLVIASGLVIWYQRVNRGDVTIFGGRK